MKQERIRFCCARLILVLVAVMLVGCNVVKPTPAMATPSLGDLYTSQVLDASYPGALSAYRQLMLGAVRLEGTDYAITSEQAKVLLVLWQSLQGRALQSDAEREAVLAYIETQMTPAQLKAIAAMRLTQNDIQSAIADNSQGFGRGGAGQRGDAGAPAGTPSAPGAGAMPPQMSTRQTQFSRVTPQAGGAPRGANNAIGAASAQDTVLLNSLIRLLSQRVAEGTAPSAGDRAIPRTPGPRSLPTPTPRP